MSFICSEFNPLLFTKNPIDHLSHEGIFQFKMRKQYGDEWFEKYMKPIDRDFDDSLPLEQIVSKANENFNKMKSDVDDSNN